MRWILLILALCSPSWAATHYVWCAAAGAATGNDWTNALTDIPDTQVRGDTYVVAGVSGGCSYGPTAAKTYKEFATAESGTTLITIRHASEKLDSGVAGWNSSFHTTQALWSATHFSGTTQMWVIRAGYYKFDGNPDKTSVIGVGSTTCYDVCGFKLVDAADFKPTGFILITCSSNPCTAPTFKGVEIDNTGVTITTTCSDGLTSSGTWNNVTLAMSYIHDVGGPFNLTAAGSGFSATNNIIARNQSSSSCHGEHISLADQTTIDIHYNTLQDCTGTGCIVQLAGTTKISSGSIYGNVFNNTTPGTYTEGNGVYSCQDSQVCTVKFFNNTITGFTGAGTSRVDSAGAGGGTAITVNNNLWYNNAAVNPAGVGMSNDYNCYESTTDASNPSEAHACTGSTNYIANIGSSDFHLSLETPSNGLNTNSLLAANTTDPDGRDRSASTDGIWSRGAFQFAPPLSGQYYAPLSPVVSPYLTVDMNSNSQWPDGVANPLVRMNCVRIWDTPGASGWAQVETSAGSYVFTSLDSTLTRAQANGVNCAFYPLNRTPTFYSSNTADISCGYYLSIGTGTVNTVGTAVTRVTGTLFLNSWTTIIINGVNYSISAFIDSSHITLGSSAGTQTGVTFNTPSTNAGSGPGQCDIPTDINPDGTGTNLHYKNWVAAVATHIKATFPTMQMYYEFYNEPDTCKFFNSDAATQGSCTGTGTENDLVRWEWDARCITKGVTSNNPFIGGQSCTTSQGLVTSVVMAGAVDATAKLLMGSYHGAPFSYNLAQNFLYCNHTPVPANCTAGRAGADNTDAINFHFKYLGKPAVQGDATTTLEPVADTWIAGMVAILQPTELHIPWYNTEGGAAAGGWVDCAVTSGVPTCNFLTEPLMEASAVARNNIYQVWKGATNAVWYDWPSSGGHGLGSVNDVNHFTDQAYDQSGQWISGATGMICLTTPPGTVHAGLFTYTCTFRNAQGQAKAAIWDNSQTCSSGVCSTTNQTVAKSYVSYTDLTGTTIPIVSNTVPVGIRPILLNVGAGSGGISGVTLKGLTAKVGSPLGPPLYLGSSTSVAALGTISSPFSAATLFNSTAHGPLNPGTNCITRFTDQNIVQFGTSTHLDDDFSVASFTASGGNNDVMTNTDTTYLGIRGAGANNWVFQTSISNGCLLNNTDGGQNPNFSVPGAFGWSRATPLKFYNLQSKAQLQQNTIVPGTPLTFTTTSSATFPFDFALCPGPAALVAPGTAGQSASILSVGLNDATFSADISWTGGQGTAHYGMMYKPGTGCATIDLGPTALFSGTASIVANVATVTTTALPNMPNGQTAVVTGASNANFNCATATITGSTASTVSYTCSPALTNTGSLTLTTGTMVGNFSNVYAYCAASCASAVPIGQTTTCYDSGYTAGSGGMHDSDSTLDGTILEMTGGCFNLGAGNTAWWQVGTTNVIGQVAGSSTCTPGNGYQYSGHHSSGINHLLALNGGVPNIRKESTVCGDFMSFTLLNTLAAGGSGGGGYHGAWSHAFNDDSLPWIVESANSVGFTTPGSMTLTLHENEINGVQVDNSLQPIIRFGPTYNSSLSGGFACSSGIGFVSQDGKWAFFLSDGFQNLGLDSSSAQLCSVFTMALQ